LPIGSRAAEVVVAAARAGQLGDGLELARRATQLERRLVTDRRFVEGDPLPVDAGSLEVFEREPESAEVLGERDQPRWPASSPKNASLGR